MQIEFGNHASLAAGVDDAPKVTTMHVPEADENGLGGYTHAPGKLSVDDFRLHRQESMDFRGGVTQLPDHEILTMVAAAWPTQSTDRPRWVKVTPTLGDEYEKGKYRGRTPDGVAEDVEKFLNEFYGCDTEKPGNFEDIYHTRFGPPGTGGPYVPEISNLFTNSGRVIANVNDGGGKVGASGTGTAATSNTFTSGSTWVTNEWAGYRLVVTNGAAIVWGNVVSNNNTGAASVATIDRWYNFATPGGAAGTTPAASWFWCILDGGMASAWFMGLATGVNAPTAADTTLATNGNAEYATASGGYLRKITAYTQTSGVAARTLTLVATFTGNGSDTYPSTFTTMGLFTGMVIASTITMKFETALTPASATVSASGDAVTVTETITGS